MSAEIATTDSEGFHGIANTSDMNREADVVFVHGLGGTSHGTWRHGTDGSAGHFFWPVSLAEDLPRCGVWTVGYPAGLTAFGKPGMIIEKRAGNLAQKLANAGLGVRPLVFITHSMGGLVLKSLIVGSQTLADADRKRIVRMIRCIVFCATPHRGSAFADAAGVLGAFFGGSQDHVDEMRANAEPLDILHDEFIEWHREHKVPVLSYAENVGLFRTRRFLAPLALGLVVPRASANPGIAGHTVRDVDDDHLTLVRPRDRKHDVYAGVLRFIRESLEAAPSAVQHGTAARPAAATQSSTSTATVVGRPRVYLSYTLRTPGLRERVFELAEQLRASGVDSRIDLYYAKSLHGFTPPDPVPNQDSWAAWQVEQVRDADRVLILCSKEFNESPNGSGAWFDVELMKQDVESGAELRKFIPVGYGDFEVNRTFIPAFIRGATYYDLTAATISGFGFEDLVRRFRTEFPVADKSEAPPAGRRARASWTEPQPADIYNRPLPSLSSDADNGTLDRRKQALEIDSTIAPAYNHRSLAHIKSAATLTWVHLSDLHLCRPKTGWDSHRVLRPLLEDLRSMQQEHGLQPDFLFFTGDLAFGQIGRYAGETLADQFDDGHTFLESVRTAFVPQIPRDNVFVVPGNHDVDRSQHSPALAAWLDAQRDPMAITELIRGGTGDWPHFMKRLAAYGAFLERHGYSHLIADPERLIYAQQRAVRGVTVGIAGLNSAWTCGRDSEKGRLWLGGDWQIGHVTSHLANAQLRIALVHHPANWFSEFEDPDIWRLIERDFTFCLHGHEHQGWVTQLAEGHTRVAAAAGYDRSGMPNGYNFVQLDLSMGTGAVWLRQFDANGGGWIKRVIARKAPDGVWSLTNLAKATET